MTALKSLLFLICVPGMLVGYLPFLISLNDTELIETGIFRYLAVPLWLIGAAAVLWCFWDFTFRGRGTPAPVDPPKELVAIGLYRYVRNPMYVSGILALVGWALWSPSLPLVVAPFLFFAATHTFVTLYEEPTLRVKFGVSYEEYLRRVPRWIPKKEDQVIDYLKTNQRTILLALILFIASSVLKLIIVPIFLPDTFPLGFPFRFFLTWNPCPQGWNCTEFNGLNLLLDLLIWYAVGLIVERRFRSKR